MAAALQEWEREVVSLARQGLETSEIAAALDKHPATIRKAKQRARDRGELGDDRVLSRDEADAAFGDTVGPAPSAAAPAIRGQTTVDDFTSGCDRPGCGGLGVAEVSSPLGTNRFCGEHASEVKAAGLRWPEWYVEMCREVPPEDDPEYEPEVPGGEWINAPGRDPLEDFKAEAGEAVGPMPPGPEEDTDPDVVSRVAGTRQMALDFGPEADVPVGGTLVVKSEKRASGHFGMGDVITGTFTARITDIGGKERFDSASEEFRAKPTAYVATITEFTVEPE